MWGVQDEDLVRHLAQSLALSPSDARRVIDEVVAYYREPVEAYVRRRHAQCQLRGMRNAQTFAAVADELSQRVVAPPALTERQLRRMIYG
jgi:hypothetical protein